MSVDEENQLIKTLNDLWNSMDELDKQIDLLTLKRNNLKDQIDSGAALLLKYGPVTRKRSLK